MDTKSALAIVTTLGFIAAAPAAPAVHHGPIDGSTTVACGTSTLLFGGAVPSNGFMAQLSPLEGYGLIINDNGPAVQSPLQGFIAVGTPFVTPSGYKPMGPVSVLALCVIPSVYVAARAW
jgi:hypothetical protein